MAFSVICYTRMDESETKIGQFVVANMKINFVRKFQVIFSFSRFFFVSIWNGVIRNFVDIVGLDSHFSPCVRPMPYLLVLLPLLLSFFWCDSDFVKHTAFRTIHNWLRWDQFILFLSHNLCNHLNFKWERRRDTRTIHRTKRKKNSFTFSYLYT